MFDEIISWFGLIGGQECWNSLSLIWVHIAKFIHFSLCPFDLSFHNQQNHDDEAFLITIFSVFHFYLFIIKFDGFFIEVIFNVGLDDQIEGLFFLKTFLLFNGNGISFPEKFKTFLDLISLNEESLLKFLYLVTLLISFNPLSRD